VEGNELTDKSGYYNGSLSIAELLAQDRTETAAAAGECVGNGDAAGLVAVGVPADAAGAGEEAEEHIYGSRLQVATVSTAAPAAAAPVAARTTTRLATRVSAMRVTPSPPPPPADPSPATLEEFWNGNVLGSLEGAAAAGVSGGVYEDADQVVEDADLYVNMEVVGADSVAGAAGGAGLDLDALFGRAQEEEEKEEEEEFYDIDNYDPEVAAAGGWYCTCTLTRSCCAEHDSKFAQAISSAPSADGAIVEAAFAFIDRFGDDAVEEDGEGMYDNLGELSAAGLLPVQASRSSKQISGSDDNTAASDVHASSSHSANKGMDGGVDMVPGMQCGLEVLQHMSTSNSTQFLTWSMQKKVDEVGEDLYTTMHHIVPPASVC
jgi:hypothetical protein